MSFGWSAGDIVAGVKFVTTVIGALREAGGVDDRFLGIRSDLQSLKSILINAKSQYSKATVEGHENLQQDVLKTCGDCCDHVVKFWTKLDKKYKKRLGKDEVAHVGEHWWKVQWVIEDMDKKIETFQMALTTKMQLASYTVFQLQVAMTQQLARVQQESHELQQESHYFQQESHHLMMEGFRKVMSMIAHGAHPHSTPITSQQTITRDPLRPKITEEEVGNLTKQLTMVLQSKSTREVARTIQSAGDGFWHVHDRLKELEASGIHSVSSGLQHVASKIIEDQPPKTSQLAHAYASLGNTLHSFTETVYASLPESVQHVVRSAAHHVLAESLESADMRLKAQMKKKLPVKDEDLESKDVKHLMTVALQFEQFLTHQSPPPGAGADVTSLQTIAPPKDSFEKDVSLEFHTRPDQPFKTDWTINVNTRPRSDSTSTSSSGSLGDTTTLLGNDSRWDISRRMTEPQVDISRRMTEPNVPPHLRKDSGVSGFRKSSDFGPTIRRNSDYPLPQAVQPPQPDPDFNKLLLKLGTSTFDWPRFEAYLPVLPINATYGRDKHTALHIAIGTVMVQGDDLRWKRGQITKAVKKLLEYGADTAARDVIGLTPVHYCIKSQNLDALEVLIGKGANVNVEDKMGRTPLWLLADDASPDMEVARTLVHAAARKGRKPFPKLIKGCDPRQRQVREYIIARI